MLEWGAILTLRQVTHSVQGSSVEIRDSTVLGN